MHISYFWTIINRPITAVTCSTAAQCPDLPAGPVYTYGPNLKQRENLSQIRSNGITLDAAWQPRRWLSLTGGYQFADAIVSSNSAEPALIGNWIPEVAHNAASADLRLAQSSLGSLSLIARISGKSFDDDQNTDLIHGYTRFDAYAEHSIRHAPHPLCQWREPLRPHHPGRPDPADHARRPTHRRNGPAPEPHALVFDYQLELI